MGSKVESVFDQMQVILDGAGFALWSENDANVLISLVDSYYKLQQKTKKKKNSVEMVNVGNKKEENDDDEEEEDLSEDVIISEVNQSLTKLRRFLQKRVPYGSLCEPHAPPFSLRSTIPPTNGEVTREKREIKTPVFPVDAFLYLETDVEELVERECISREYCRTCGSVDIGLCEFITHSFAQEQLVYLSCFLLPSLSEPSYFLTDDMRLRRHYKMPFDAAAPFSCQKVVDVGSRLGIVLLSCYFAAQQKRLCTTRRVTGVEVDETMVNIQRDVIKRFATKPNSVVLNVVHSNCLEGDGEAALRDADVIILHNVFEYFSATPLEHLQSWRRLREIVARPGQLLICLPSLEETFSAFTDDVAHNVLTCEMCPAGDAATQEQQQQQAKHGFNRKRQRNEEGESVLKRWLQSWVKEIDVTEVQETFFAFCHGGECGACHDDQSHCSEVDNELMERVQGVNVYMVTEQGV